MLNRVVREVRVANPLGLHIRPAYLIARLAGNYESSIEISKDGQGVNGKSVLEILMLAATQGTMLTIVARGRDAVQAVEALVPVIEHGLPPEAELPLAEGNGSP
jgi:phosphocarrier protein